MKKRVKRNFFIGIAIVSILIIIFIFGISQNLIGTFEFGFLPYGESGNQITDLVKTNTITGSGAGISSVDDYYTSKYWDILTHSFSGYGFGSGTPTIKGNDFELIISTGTLNTKITTTENFNERDFKAKINLIAGGCTRNPCADGSGNFAVFLKTSEKEHNVFGKSIGGGESIEGLLVISPSVVSNKITIFWQGEKIKEVNVQGEYKIEIRANARSQTQKGSPSHGGTSHLKIINPSYKQQFGCTKEPGEQYYRIMFNEGDSVNLNKLDEFKKFCLAESPLTIFSNIGSTTDVEVLEDLVNGEKFTVPRGEIWSIDYIGDITLFKTECESDGIYNLNDRKCTARTVLTTSFPNGEEIIVETEPAPYYLPSLNTHQDLEKNGEFLFTYLLDDYDEYTEQSFKIGTNTFSSGNAKFEGSNLVALFNFAGKNYEGKTSEIFKLNDYLDVKISEIDAYQRDGRMNRFIINYIFSIDSSFLTTTFENGEFIVNNNYQTFDGGLTITTTDNVGTTNIEVIEKTLILGETNFEIDTTNILSIKARPFINIETPEHTYTLDSKKAYSSEIPFETTSEEEDGKFNYKFLLIIIPISILILISFIFYNLIKNKRRKK